jgi:hypothetical protein
MSGVGATLDPVAAIKPLTQVKYICGMRQTTNSKPLSLKLLRCEP